MNTDTQIAAEYSAIRHEQRQQLALAFDRFADAVEAQRAIRVRDPHCDPAQKPRLSQQNAAVLERLKRGPLTSLQAINELGVLRCAARVHDLAAAGYEISTRRLDKGVAEYTLIGGAE